MKVTDVISVLPNTINVRIRFSNTQNNETRAFRTGRTTTPAFLSALKESGLDDAIVISMFPLWNAKEVYIEAL
jgi:hypothetical protein